ncbi:hypothetical protein BDR26DRAFT_457843 [Obelidium mucronatum]|nr:hypothetical protein BDR26DRAFT_457843 [Obelidium mucronatum]
MSNNASPFLWVKLGNCRSIEISTESCRNVHELIKKVKAEASSLAGVSIERINLYTGDPVRNEALRPGLLLTEISSQTGYSRNDDAHPLFVAVGELQLHSKS